MGHLGSFAHRKADAIIQVSKDRENGNVSIVEPVDCREKEFMPFAFSILENGLPDIVDDYRFVRTNNLQKTAKASVPKALTHADLDREQHLEIIREVFITQKEYAYGSLWKSIKTVAGRTVGNTIGDNSSKNFIPYYQSLGMVTKIEMAGKKTIYVSTLGRQKVEQGGFEGL